MARGRGGYAAQVPSRRIALYLACAAAALAEMTGLRAAGLIATLPLAAQASALAPLMAFHDDRWILVYASSWPVLAGELVAALGVRTAMTSAFVLLAWPGERRPGVGTLVTRSAAAYAVLLAVMSPWALLSFVTAVTSVSYPLIGGIVVAGVLAVVVFPHAGIARWWWARLPPWRAMAWAALDLVVVVVAAIGIDYSPGWVVLAPAGAAGLLHAWCWERVVCACAPRRASEPGAVRKTILPTAYAAVAVGLTVVMATVVTYIGRSFPMTTHLRTAALPHAGQQSVLLVDGYQSRWNGGTPEESFKGFVTTQFSYRGLDAHGRPLSYASVTTTRSLRVLARHLGTQVDELAHRTGRPVDVVAVSEGTYIVREYLSMHRHVPLGTIVLASPLPRPDRVFAPPVGDGGDGFAASLEISAILDLSRDEQPTLDIAIGMPMVRSLLSQGPLFRQRSLCPHPGVRIVSLLPITAALDDPPGPVSGVPAGVIPQVHAALVQTPAVRRHVQSVLSGKPLGRYFGWGLGFQLLRYAASAGETPSLPLDAVGTWRRHGADRWGDTRTGTYGCPATDHPSSTVGPLRAAARASRR